MRFGGGRLHARACCICRHSPRGPLKLWLRARFLTPPRPRLASPFRVEYNDNGKIPGITGNVDVDVFAGSMSELLKLCF